MPYEGSAGHGPETARKQERFTKLLRVHLAATYAVIDRNSWAQRAYHFIDLTAGPGEVAGIEGSPLIFIREAARLERPYWGWFCEQDDQSAAELQQRLLDEGPIGERAQVFAYDNALAVPEIAEWLRSVNGAPFGLIYADPNGTWVPVTVIAELVREFPRLDVLLNVSAANYKRFEHCDLVKGPPLFEHLDQIGKRYRFLSTPRHRHQWTFILLTNWSGFKEIEKIGLYDERTDRGEAVRNDLEFTTEERKQKWQPRLF